MSKKKYSTRDDKYHPEKMPSEITRKLYVYYGTAGWQAEQIYFYDFKASPDSERVLIAETEITVKISPRLNLKDKLLDALKEEEKSIKAEFHMKLKGVQEKIQQLLAIDYRPEAS